MEAHRSLKRLKAADDVRPADRPGELPNPVETTLFISNLHCPSCVNAIEEALFALSPKPLKVLPSIVLHSVSVSHYSTLSAGAIVEALEQSGFEIHSAFQKDTESQQYQILPEAPSDDDWEDSLQQAIKGWRQTWKHSKSKERQMTSADDDTMGKRQRHAEQCPECQVELRGGLTDELPLRQYSPPWLVGESTESSLPYATPYCADYKSSNDSKDAEVAGKTTYSSSELSDKKQIEVVVDPALRANKFKAELAIVGMTCSACVGSITSVVEALPWVESVNVALLTNSATVVFEGRQNAQQLVEAIEDSGFDVSIETLEEVRNANVGTVSGQTPSDRWLATYNIGGMSCSSCVGSITDTVKRHDWVCAVNINLISNTGTIEFVGKVHLAALTEMIEHAGFDAVLDSIVSTAEREEKLARERRVAILVDGMYCHHCPSKILGMLEQDWSGIIQVEHAPDLKDPILRIRYVANPPGFTIRDILAALNNMDRALKASVYHPPTIEDKSRDLHRRERRRILLRLVLSVSAAIPAFIIGIVCMSLLKPGNPTREFVMAPMWAGNVSRADWAMFLLSTPVYFFAADTFHRKAIKEVTMLWRPGSRTPILRRLTRFGSMNMLMSLGTSIAYFSSIAELIMSATQSSDDGANGGSYFDSVIFLTMFLLLGRFLEAFSKAKTGDAVNQLAKLRPNEAVLVDVEKRLISVVPVDQLEVGDIVRVHPGASPPFDGAIIEGDTTFDESSLTGESRLVQKAIGDTVFSGTVNRRGPIKIRIANVDGTSMLDQIIKVVREGQARRAPVERAADVITSHFVPFVVAVGVLTWLIWLVLGQSGALPRDWLDANTSGGWPLWSLRFAIAVFVIACPCGIGLAAPTALFVGGGMAAKHGILVKGGGEAFQEASSLDCIVFDKTGTLTEGGGLNVMDYHRCSDDEEKEVLGMVMALEQQSGHPIAGAIVKFCEEKDALPLEMADVEELPGRGVRGTFKLKVDEKRSINAEVLVGNERLLSEHDVDISPLAWSGLQSWKRMGKSVVCVAIRTEQAEQHAWTLSAIFAVSDALRPEATSTVAALKSRGISVWMLSGDNATTAQAVAAQVGIHPDNTIAGVLPDQKADKIQYLQKTLPFKGRGKKCATVAMVGDGINDSPALTMADVGIAIGSGSDVAISSADFILVSSDLKSLLTLIDLSRTVFRRIWFNFGWALVYNLVALPVAAGALYAVRTGGGGHVRLDPVWASLAMAMSSVSVVSSSLLLRSRLPLVGFKGSI